MLQWDGRWKHLNPWVVIDSTTNSGCWWSVLFLIWSCDIVLIISVTVIIFIIVMTLMMMTMMMVTCMGLSWTLYSFSSSLPRRPLPFLLTGLKMQSSDLSSRDHVFCLFPFPFFVFFHSFVHLISTLFCHSWAGRSSSLGRILSCPSLCRRRYLFTLSSWPWSISSSSSPWSSMNSSLSCPSPLSSYSPSLFTLVRDRASHQGPPNWQRLQSL